LEHDPIIVTVNLIGKHKVSLYTAEKKNPSVTAAIGRLKT